MSTKLFNDIIFGPIKSRRLGISLGVNLLPSDGKVCSFDCIYCECGYNSVGKGSGIPTKEVVVAALTDRLKAMSTAGEALDVITFAGNGEPTLHPHFEEIIAFTLQQRDTYYPEAKVSVLSNATAIGNPRVFAALNKVDNNILKLDAVLADTVQLINAPNNPHFSLEQLVEQLKQFRGNLTIQTLFLRGMHDGKVVDNTTPEALSAWLEAIKEIAPKQVMVYSLDRATPEKALQRLSHDELQTIAHQVEQLGIAVTVA